MRQLMVVSAIAIGLTATARTASLSTAEVKRIEQAATVLQEIHAAPDKGIPDDLWNKASCVVVVPSLKKAALIFGGEYGKGLMSCRRAGACGPLPRTPRKVL